MVERYGANGLPLKKKVVSDSLPQEPVAVVVQPEPVAMEVVEEVELELCPECGVNPCVCDEEEE